MEGEGVKCAKCNRPLKRPSETGYGPVCLRALFGAKPKKVKAEPVKRDELTRPLFDLEEAAAA